MERTTRRRLFDVTAFLNVISGRQRGFRASLLRGVLWLLQFPYALAVRRRNWQFDTGRRPIERVGVPVISVGNITTGGTGKTPLVAWIARQLHARDLRVTLISRGYGAARGAVNDEALELERQLPSIPHLQNPDRIAAARLAEEQYQPHILLLDDAFQHRRIHRDLDIVLLDALDPWGFGYLLPRGLLREPRTGLRRADLIGLSRADLVPPATREQIRQVACRENSGATWFEICHRPRHLVNHDGSTRPLPDTTAVPILAFCGLGNPNGFRRSLEQCGFEVLDWRIFPDHHAYSPDDIESLSDWSSQFPDARQIVCTRKDLVKLSVTHLGSLPLHALAIEAEFLQGEKEVLTRLENAAMGAKT